MISSGIVAPAFRSIVCVYAAAFFFLVTQQRGTQRKPSDPAVYGYLSLNCDGDSWWMTAARLAKKRYCIFRGDGAADTTNVFSQVRPKPTKQRGSVRLRRAHLTQDPIIPFRSLAPREIPTLGERRVCEKLGSAVRRNVGYAPAGFLGRLLFARVVFTRYHGFRAAPECR